MCYKCGRYGHGTASCPQTPPTMNVNSAAEDNPTMNVNSAAQDNPSMNVNSATQVNATGPSTRTRSKSSS